MSKDNPTLKELQKERIRKEALENLHQLNILLEKGIPEIEWLAKDIIPSRGITFFAGETESYKSWTAMELALSVATGTKFLNWFETKKKTVLYIDEENGDVTIPVRFNKLLEARNMGKEVKIPVPENLFISILNNVNIDQEPDLLKFLIEKFKPQLVIVDSVVRCMKGNENDSQDVRSIYDNLKDIYKKHKEMAFVLLHHMTKTNSGTVHSLRGSGDFGAMAENAINFEKKGEKELRMKITKSRHLVGKPWYDVIVFSEDSQSPVSLHASPSDDTKSEVEIAMDCIKDWLKDKQQFITGKDSDFQREAIEVNNITESTKEEAIRQLITKKVIRRDKKANYTNLEYKGGEIQDNLQKVN